MADRVKARTDFGAAGDGRVRAVVVESEGLMVRAALVDGRPEVALGATEGVWALRRVGGQFLAGVTREAGGGLSGVGADGSAGDWEWGLEVSEDGEGVAVTATGRAGALVQAIGLMVRPGDGWLEVTEVLSSEAGVLPAMEAFESRWRFGGGGALAEVFTPSLVPLRVTSSVSTCSGRRSWWRRAPISVWPWSSIPMRWRSARSCRRPSGY